MYLDVLDSQYSQLRKKVDPVQLHFKPKTGSYENRSGSIFDTVVAAGQIRCLHVPEFQTKKLRSVSDSIVKLS